MARLGFLFAGGENGEIFWEEHLRTDHPGKNPRNMLRFVSFHPQIPSFSVKGLGRAVHPRGISRDSCLAATEWRTSGMEREHLEAGSVLSHQSGLNVGRKLQHIKII